MQKRCITQGHWRRCLACALLQREDSSSVQVCTRCKCKRDSAAFGDDRICSSCKLQENWDVCLCGICSRIKPTKDMREKVLGSGNFSCSECTPNLWRYACTVCHEEKPSADFRDPKSKLEKHSIRRCKVCETCISCHRHFDDFSNFATNARYCRSCYRASVEIKNCQVCGEAKAASAFPDSQLYHESDASQSLFLRCNACHICKVCNEEKYILSFDGASAVCIKCKEMKKCRVCGQGESGECIPK